GGGGGGGGDGGGGGGDEPTGGGGVWSCGDLRDTLAAEYVGKNISNGPWDCHKFSLVLSRFVVPDGDIEWGMRHDYYAYVDGSLIGGVALVEAHFGVNFEITSGYRCPRGNGGAANSRHVRGRAADIWLEGWTDAYKDSIIDWARARWGPDMEAERYPVRDHVHLGWPY
ncbi:MAG: D-Ala-D-Ala carboxypeptidase family metallohydrolase, partial [Gemmatimonadota bacterium]|nr:D-Ala-D-Ala carboxypeptidase family metallohydrolase [Gemmatimonadota bacterium]